MKQALMTIKKDRLNSGEQLIFLDYLTQCLKNGFSLNLSLQLMPTIWQSKKELLNNLDKELEEGKNLGQILIKLGFSHNIATQLNMALLEGSLIECLTQLTKLIRLKNKQLKKLKSELAYPGLLVVMMLSLLVAMQTFLKTEIGNDDWMSDIIFCLLLALIIAGIFSAGWFFYLLKKQDYHSLKKLILFPIIGKTIKLYVQYLLVYDISILIANGFSLQQMCELSQTQAKDSIQAYLGKTIAQKLEAGENLEKIINSESFLPNNLMILVSTGNNRNEISQKSALLGKTLFYELNLKLTRLIVNIQPICFLFIGGCILGMYLKILMPMYSLMQNI